MDATRPQCAAPGTPSNPPQPPTPLEEMHSELEKIADAYTRIADGINLEYPVEFWAPYTLGQLQRVRYYAEQAMHAIEAAWNRDDASGYLWGDAEADDNPQHVLDIMEGVAGKGGAA